jgi:hypothetical protein
MTKDDSADLRLRAGKIRDRGSAGSRRPRSFVAQVMKAVTKAKASGRPVPVDEIHAERQINRYGDCPVIEDMDRPSTLDRLGHFDF